MRTLILAALVLAGAAHAVEPMVPYDNFNPGEPSPATPSRVHGVDWTRWLARDVGGAGRDDVRKQAGMRLRLRHSSGDSAGALGLAFIAPASVTAIEAKVRVVGASAAGCGLVPGYADAQLGGAFFNSGAPVRGSAAGDVRAWLRLTRASTDAPHADLALTAVVERCDDANCSTRTTLWSSALGPVVEELRATLRVTWDASNDTFVFGRDGRDEASWRYAMPDSAAPGVALKSLEAGQRLPVCAAAMGSVNAYFHDVLVNASAAPVL